jgi:hypothetical protein
MALLWKDQAYQIEKVNLHQKVLWARPQGLGRFEVWSREVLLRGKASTVDLLVLTCLDKLIFILKILFTFASKQAT